MVVANNKIDETKNAGKSTTISVAMAMQRYDAGRIARWSTSRASLEATGCRHRVSASAVKLLTALPLVWSQICEHLNY